MRARTMVLIAIAALLAAAAAWVGWMVRFRPLTVFAWQERFALRAGGLKRVVVPTPVGPQVAFVGGEGPVLVLLHGAGDQAGTWFRVAPALARTHRLIVPDLAGHGGSAPAAGPIEIRQVLEAAEAVIGRLANGDRVALAGNSLGAWVAMLIAQRHPERVAVAVCIDGGAIKGSNLHARILPADREQARESVAQTRDPGSAPVPGFVLDDVVRQARVGPLARFAATADTMEAYTRSEAELAALATPVGLIWGESDRLVPLDYAERMARALPHVKLFTIPKCGHVPQIECPDRLLAALRTALE